jgi:hypothetical protein
MADADTSSGDDPETTNINIRLTEALLDDIDGTWKAEGYTNRSEFIRAVLRDAAAHPEFSRRMWKQIATSEYRRAEGELATYSREEVLEEMDADE